MQYPVTLALPSSPPQVSARYVVPSARSSGSASRQTAHPCAVPDPSGRETASHERN